MAQVLGQLLVQRGLDHYLGQLLQQPVRPGQGQPLLPRLPDQLLGRRLLGRRFRLLLLTVSSVSVITAPFLLNTRLSDQDRKHL